MTFKHPGQAWKLCYASGGVTPQAFNLAGPEPGSTDTYFATEAALANSPMPAWASNRANDNLEREAARHFGDLSTAELRAALDREDAAKLDAAVAMFFNEAGYNVIFCAHQLNSLLPQKAANEADDPIGVVVVVPGLPARDRNNDYSTRTSCRKHESLRNFLDAPGAVLAGLEQVSVQQGFCLPKLFGRHSGVIQQRNAANCPKAQTVDGSDAAIGRRIITATVQTELRGQQALVIG